MQYKILESYSRKEMEKIVNESIQEGWNPLGGISIATDYDKDILFTQSMIKRSDNVNLD